MDPARCVKAIVTSNSVKDVKEACDVLIEDDFEVSLGSGVISVHRAPFNVKLPVRRGAGN